jgi:RNA polymerase sigma factor (sigma-70 family)
MKTARAMRHDFEQLWLEQGPLLWRAIYAYTGGRRSTTDDVVAEAFARGLAYDETIRDPVAWLFRTAFRLAASEMRRERRLDGSVPETSYEDDGSAVELMEALRRLPERQRACLFLHYYGGLPLRRVAAVLGLSTAAVKLHLLRGRRRMGRLLWPGGRNE